MRRKGYDMAQIIATAASMVAAVCNIILMILLYRWYGSESDKCKNPCITAADICRAKTAYVQGKKVNDFFIRYTYQFLSALVTSGADDNVVVSSTQKAFHLWCPQSEHHVLRYPEG